MFTRVRVFSQRENRLFTSTILTSENRPVKCRKALRRKAFRGQYLFYCLLMVGVAGFEPTTSKSQIAVGIFFLPFRAIFDPFRSENDALRRSCPRCFHAFRGGLWDKMWSGKASQAVSPSKKSFAFNILSLNLREVKPPPVKICAAVNKEIRRTPSVIFLPDHVRHSAPSQFRFSCR